MKNSELENLGVSTLNLHEMQMQNGGIFYGGIYGWLTWSYKAAVELIDGIEEGFGPGVRAGTRNR